MSHGISGNIGPIMPTALDDAVKSFPYSDVAPATSVYS